MSDCRNKAEHAKPRSTKSRQWFPVTLLSATTFVAILQKQTTDQIPPTSYKPRPNAPATSPPQPIPVQLSSVPKRLPPLLPPRSPSPSLSADLFARHMSSASGSCSAASSFLSHQHLLPQAPHRVTGLPGPAWACSWRWLHWPSYSLGGGSCGPGLVRNPGCNVPNRWLKRRIR